jgi:sugar phosphate isomerase/epimerase
MAQIPSKPIPVPDLIASYWTLAGGGLPHTDREYSTFEFKERVEAAARAGFRGIGLWHSDLDHVTKTRSLKEMKKILDDNGMKYVEIEFLADWFVDGEKRRESDKRRKMLFDAAAQLGGRHVKVGDFFNTKFEMPRLIDEFGKLCREAAKIGTKIGYEIMPFCELQTLEQARALCEGAAPKNGGIIFDLWHIVKLKIPYADVWKFPQQYFVGLEINDGYLNPPTKDIVEETTQHRKLCGYGEFDVKGFTSMMASSHYKGPVGIEVLSKEIRSWPLEKIAKIAFESTAAQFA